MASDPPVQVAESVFWCYLVLSCLVYAPSTIYYTINYFRIHKSQLVRKRYPRIVIFTSLFGIVSTTIRPCYLQWSLSYTKKGPINTNTIPKTIHSLLYPFLTHAFIYLVVWRMYLLFFKFKYLEATQQLSWLQYINKKVY